MGSGSFLGDGAHLVGHSFGGCVALAATSRRPTAVKSLTLIEPGMQALAIDRLPVLLFVLRMLATLKLSFSCITTHQAILEVDAHPRHDGWCCGLVAKNTTRWDEQSQL